jgi:hypothetical protein
MRDMKRDLDAGRGGRHHGDHHRRGAQHRRCGLLAATVMRHFFAKPISIPLLASGVGVPAIEGGLVASPRLAAAGLPRRPSAL